MKSALFALTMILANQALACTPEAQVIATVTESKLVSQDTCSVKIAAPDFFAENQLCPLQLDEILINPILVRSNGPNCPAKISGVVVQTEKDGFVLE